MKRYLLVFVTVFLASCTTQTPQNPTLARTTSPTAAPTAIAAVPASAPAFFATGLRAYRTNGWDTMLGQAIADLGANLTRVVPSDIASYCPNYPAMVSAQRATVWQSIFIALTKFESNYKPGELLDETTFDPDMLESNGDPIISRGLLQISIGSANGYACRIGNAQELHDPATNLRCGVRIASQWVERDGVISGGSKDAGWRGMARYWSPFRRADRLSDIQQAVRSTPGC